MISDSSGDFVAGIQVWSLPFLWCLLCGCSISSPPIFAVLGPPRRLVGGIKFYTCPSVRPYENFRQAFLRNRKWDWFETWQDSLAWCIVRCKRLLWLSDINFLFDGTLFTLNTAKYTEFFVKFFSETVSGNDLKLDRMVKYGVSYVVSNFQSCRTSTSCLRGLVVVAGASVSHGHISFIWHWNACPNPLPIFLGSSGLVEVTDGHRCC